IKWGAPPGGPIARTTNRLVSTVTAGGSGHASLAGDVRHLQATALRLPGQPDGGARPNVRSTRHLNSVAHRQLVETFPLPIGQTETVGRRASQFESAAGADGDGLAIREGGIIVDALPVFAVAHRERQAVTHDLPPAN